MEKMEKIWTRYTSLIGIAVLVSLDYDRKMEQCMDGYSSESSRYNVFLGGSCGGRQSPTTWRTDVAIPLLQEKNITFFNPQVEQWSSDLIVQEHNAKENSDWLLFMLEATTRGIVSIVEVAYCMGSGRSVIFVVQEERCRGKLCIQDDTVSSLEAEDITRSQQLVETLTSQHKRCKFHTMLTRGLDHIVDGISNNEKGSSLVQHGNSYSGKNNILVEWLQKINSLITNPSSKNKAQQLNTQKATPTEQTKRKRPDHLKIILTKRMVGVISSENSSAHLIQSILDLTKSPSASLPHDAVYEAKGTDVKDMDCLQECALLVVYIPSTALASDAMCKAAYLLSKSKRIILCVQDITVDSVDNGNTQLTKSAAADYNRARAYLRDMASRNNHIVTASLEDSLELASVQVQNMMSRRHSLPSTIAEV